MEQGIHTEIAAHRSHKPLKTGFTVLKLCTSSILLAGFFSLAFSRVDPDIGWHIRAGEWTAKNVAVPRSDEYSHTMPGYQWVNHEWLVDTWLWHLTEQNNWEIAGVVFALLAFFPIAYWIYKARSLLELFMILLASLFLIRVSGIRSQMLSFFLFFVVYEALLRIYVHYEQKRRFLYAGVLPLLFFIWANLHGGFIAGLGIWACMYLAHYGKQLWKTRTISMRSLRFAIADGILLSISAGATLLTPYGFDLYKEIGAASFSPETLAYIKEWRPLVPYSAPFSLLLFFSMLGVLFAATRKTAAYAHEAVSAAVVTLLVFLKSVRNGPFFFVTIAPLIRQGAEAFQHTIRAERAGFPFNKKQMVILSAGAVLFYSTAITAFLYLSMVKQPAQYPEAAVLFIKTYTAGWESKKPVRLFNDYGWGGYIIATAPDMPVFIDGRMPHWETTAGESAMKDYINVFYAKHDEWRTVFKKHNITIVLIKNTAATPRTLRAKLRNAALTTKPGAWLNRALLPGQSADLAERLLSRNWRIIYEDPIARVLICRTEPCY